MINTVLEHVPIKLETLDDDHFSDDCSEAAGGRSRRTTATASRASSTSSRTTQLDNEIESCGNVFIYNRRKLFLICGFCDSKYANMLQFAKHLNDCHKIFYTSDDDLSSHLAHSVGAASEVESDSDASSAVSGLIVKGGFQIRFVREGSMCSSTDTLTPTPPSMVDDNLLKHVPIKVEVEESVDDVASVDGSLLSNFEHNIESCGNIFVMNRRKLFLICGFCEGKYANMELFASHLQECHSIFDEELDEPVKDVTVKQEPTEEESSQIKRNDTNNENAPPMVALPTGISVDNKNIIPQEEIETIVEAAKKRKVVVDDVAAVATDEPPTAVLRETRNQKQNSAKTTPPAKTIKDYFVKDDSDIFACKECPKSFNKQSRLIEHIRLHTGEKPFKCPECDKTFRIKLRMTEHQLRHRTEKAFICEVCGLGMATRQDYALHQRHHKGDKRYPCPECGKAFVRRSDLKTHIRIHSDERPFKCEICQLTFRANQNLIIHRRVHQGDRQFKCDYCDKRFLRKIDKRVHHRVHTGEKAFKCEICDKGYSAKVHVRRHIEKRHMGDQVNIAADGNTTAKKPDKVAKKQTRPFKCTSCSKTYSTKVTLQKHIDQMHGSDGEDDDKLDSEDPSNSLSEAESIATK